MLDHIIHITHIVQVKKAMEVICHLRVKQNQIIHIIHINLDDLDLI